MYMFQVCEISCMVDQLIVTLCAKLFFFFLLTVATFYLKLSYAYKYGLFKIFRFPYVLLNRTGFDIIVCRLLNTLASNIC